MHHCGYVVLVVAYCTGRKKAPIGVNGSVLFFLGDPPPKKKEEDMAVMAVLWSAAHLPVLRE